MSDPLTKAAKALNSLHSSIHELSSHASNPKTFPKVVSVVILGSGLLGLGLLQIVNWKRDKNLPNYYQEQKRRDMSQDERLVRAMIENAKSSTMKENLENAAIAQNAFMLIPFDESVTNDIKNQKLIQRIVQRSNNIREANSDDENIETS